MGNRVACQPHKEMSRQEPRKDAKSGGRVLGGLLGGSQLYGGFTILGYLIGVLVVRESCTIWGFFRGPVFSETPHMSPHSLLRGIRPLIRCCSDWRYKYPEPPSRV